MCLSPSLLSLLLTLPVLGMPMLAQAKNVNVPFDSTVVDRIPNLSKPPKLSSNTEKALNQNQLTAQAALLSENLAELIKESPEINDLSTFDFNLVEVLVQIPDLTKPSESEQLKPKQAEVLLEEVFSQNQLPSQAELPSEKSAESIAESAVTEVIIPIPHLSKSSKLKQLELEQAKLPLERVFSQNQLTAQAELPTEEPEVGDPPTSEPPPAATEEPEVGDPPTSEPPPAATEEPEVSDPPTSEPPPAATEEPGVTNGEQPNQSQPEAEPRVLVAEVNVVGADETITNIVYNTIATEPGRTTTRSQLQEDVNAVYATGFFQDVQVIPADTPLGVRITFAVQPNPILNEVAIQTVPADAESRVIPPEVVNETFSDSYGQILNLRELQDGIREINDWYSDNGYELAQVVGSPNVSADGTVTLVVAEGVIEDINVRFFDEEDEPAEGNTRDFIVTREIELEPGDVFKRDTAQRDLQRVFGLGIFEDARFSFSPGSDPSKVIVNVDLVEDNTGSIAVGGGISSSSGLFGSVSYQQQNLGGNRQTLGAEFQLGERDLLFDVSFTDPWIAGDSNRTSYTVNAFSRRSISLVFNGDDNDIEVLGENDEDGDSPRVVRTGGGINFSRPLAEDPFSRPTWTLSTGFQYQRVRINNSDGDRNSFALEVDEEGDLVRDAQNNVVESDRSLTFNDGDADDLFIFRFGATRDRRNNPLQPTKGSLLRVGVDQSVPIGSGSILFNRLRGSYSYYIPAKLINFSDGPQAFAFNVQAGTVFGDLPPYEAFVLGGSNSVRGFADGEVGSGRSFVQATAEYRFPIFSVVGGALFVDYGTTLGSDDNVPGEPSKVRDLPGNGFGYGIGVRVRSPLGPIRVDYAINDEGDNRIHFGIGERF